MASRFSMAACTELQRRYRFRVSAVTRTSPPCYYLGPATVMSEIDRIRGFLGAVRRRLLVRAAIETAGFGAAALVVVLLALAGAAAAVGPAGFWPAVTAVMLALLGLVALTYGLIRPARALREDGAAARRV